MFLCVRERKRGVFVCEREEEGRGRERERERERDRQKRQRPVGMRGAEQERDVRVRLPLFVQLWMAGVALHVLCSCRHLLWSVIYIPLLLSRQRLVGIYIRRESRKTCITPARINTHPRSPASARVSRPRCARAPRVNFEMYYSSTDH